MENMGRSMKLVRDKIPEIIFESGKKHALGRMYGNLEDMERRYGRNRMR